MFTDGQALSFGTRTTKRNARTIVGSAYSPWQLWDGHKDSLWAQAVEPIEHPDEQGTTRLHAVHLVRQDETYRALYEAVFGPLPDELADLNRFPDSGGPVEYEPYQTAWRSMSTEDQATASLIFVNLGKAIEAYERLIGFGPGRFDFYAKAALEGDVDRMDSLLTVDEVAGLRLFIGKANCVQCHSGPLFTDNGFHNTGVPAADAPPADQGRAGGVPLVLGDVFNCQGIYSDAPETGCAALSSIETSTEDLVYSFRTPTLRSVTGTAPYMHTGQFESLRQVLVHYNRAPQAPAGQTALSALDLSEVELDQLEAFLHTLTAPPAASPELLQPPAD
jgi:cytochrome c peroxidase